MVRRKDDPYVDFARLFSPKDQIDAIPYCETGEVTMPLPDLEVTVRSLPYRKDQIKLDEYWVKGHEREIEIPMAPFNGSDTHGDGHVSGGYPKAKIIFKDELKVGDLVACLQSKDKQTLYVLFKIARWD